MAYRNIEAGQAFPVVAIGFCIHIIIILRTVFLRGNFPHSHLVHGGLVLPSSFQLHGDRVLVNARDTCGSAVLFEALMLGDRAGAANQDGTRPMKKATAKRANHKRTRLNPELRRKLIVGTPIFERWSNGSIVAGEPALSKP
jgi:hypothetical protein